MLKRLWVGARSKRVWLAALAFTSASCGGDVKGTGDSSCPAAAACGGNLVGVWHVDSLCAKASLSSITQDGGTGLPTECNGALEGALDATVATPTNATIEFTTDGQYVETGEVIDAFPAVYSKECLAALGSPPASTSSCGQIANGFAASSPGATGTCNLVSGGCQCSASVPEAFTETGPYRADGTSLFLDDSSPGGSFCVQGNSASVTIDADGTTGTLELTRD